MKKRQKRKGGKAVAAAADLQAPPRYRKLGDVREALEIWANGTAADFAPVDPVTMRAAERSAAEDHES